MKESIITWSIENISYCWLKKGEPLRSSKFFVAPLKKRTWLSLYPRGLVHSDYMSLFLFSEEEIVEEADKVSFEFSCLAPNASVLHSCLIPKNLAYFTEGVGYGPERFMLRHEVLGHRKALYLPNDTLTLRCRIWKDEDLDETQEVVEHTRLTTERIISVLSINPEKEEQETINIQTPSGNETFMSIGVWYLYDNLEVEISLYSELEMMASNFQFSLVDKGTERKLIEFKKGFTGVPKETKWRMPISRNDNFDSSNLEFVAEIVYSTGEWQHLTGQECPSTIPEYISSYMRSCVDSGNLSDMPTISKNIYDLYKAQEFCDFRFKVKKTNIRAHRIVLCARSPVFLNMLRYDMKEKEDSFTIIEDILVNIFKIFLNFLYTDDFKDLDLNKVRDLYYVADKYQVERLKLLCCIYFLNHIDFDNACALLVTAYLHNEHELKRNVCNFMRENRVIQSPAFKELSQDQQEQVKQAMQSENEERGIQGYPETYVDRLSRVPTIQDDYRSYFRLQNDVVVRTNGPEIPALKIVLCASSPKFKKMFKDNPTGPLDISDLDANIANQMLSFLVTDTLENMQWITAFELYKVAVLYEIDRLKIKCSCYLLENVTVSKVYDLLQFSLQQNDDQLKSAVEHYICLYDEEIFGSEKWDEFSTQNVELANQIMCAKYRKY